MQVALCKMYEILNEFFLSINKPIQTTVHLLDMVVSAMEVINIMAGLLQTFGAMIRGL